MEAGRGLNVKALQGLLSTYNLEEIEAMYSKSEVERCLNLLKNDREKEGRVAHGANVNPMDRW